MPTFGPDSYIIDPFVTSSSEFKFRCRLLAFKRCQIFSRKLKSAGEKKSSSKGIYIRVAQLRWAKSLPLQYLPVLMVLWLLMDNFLAFVVPLKPPCYNSCNSRVPLTCPYSQLLVAPIYESMLAPLGTHRRYPVEVHFLLDKNLCCSQSSEILASLSIYVAMFKQFLVIVNV